MAIHYINAYEEKGEDGRATAVIVDCCEHYGDPAIIETLVLHRLRSLRDKDVLPNARYVACGCTSHRVRCRQERTN
jgi:carlactone synthase/all-trans-10'-apo-beta-carotenal 13,14-cleaving dioxygenase